MPPTLARLPPELLDHVIGFVETAGSVSNLGATNNALHTYVENNAWKKFVASRFPSISSSEALSYKDAARRLTTLSKAWDRRALVARYVEPQGKIRSFPQDQIIERWQRPRGQTLGFTPQLDCFDDPDSSVLAFSTGAGICIRRRNLRTASRKDATWMVYRPPDAVEGRDDVTSLHLYRPGHGPEALQIITGTANGHLQLLQLPDSEAPQIPKSHFLTDGLPVRSSSVLQQPGTASLLAATIDDSRIVLYEMESGQKRISPSSTTDVHTNGSRKRRAWSSQFLSSTSLAVGLGPCSEPLQVYSITPSGIGKEALRKFSLQHESDYPDNEFMPLDFVTKPVSSIYPIAPLAPASHSMAGSEAGQIFLSGAYDGIIRLHDLRSHRDVEQVYADPTDESAIYSLLPRGRESVAAGSSRHSLLKIFDLRLGAKAYSHLNAEPTNAAADGKDWNLFLKRHSATYAGRGGGNNWARRSAESSVYNLVSPASSSPFIYAGLENAVLELAVTSVLDPYPDPAFHVDTSQRFSNSDVVDLSMYDQTADMMKLKTQRSLAETRRFGAVEHRGDILPGLDERWRVAS